MAGLCFQILPYMLNWFIFTLLVHKLIWLIEFCLLNFKWQIFQDENNLTINIIGRSCKTNAKGSLKGRRMRHWKMRGFWDMDWNLALQHTSYLIMLPPKSCCKGSSHAESLKSSLHKESDLMSPFWHNVPMKLQQPHSNSFSDQIFQHFLGHVPVCSWVRKMVSW